MTITICLRKGGCTALERCAGRTYWHILLNLQQLVRHPVANYLQNTCSCGCCTKQQQHTQHLQKYFSAHLSNTNSMLVKTLNATSYKQPLIPINYFFIHFFLMNNVMCFKRQKHHAKLNVNLAKIVLIYKKIHGMNVII